MGAQTFKKMNRATSANANSIRNQRFLMQTLKRPDSSIKQRFEHLTPRERQRQRQELIDQFKNNVMNMIDQKPKSFADANYSQQLTHDSKDPEQLMNSLTNQSLNKPDTYLLRKQQKRQALMEKSHTQLEETKFWETRGLYKRGDE